MSLTPYERQRQQNIARNHAILVSLGLEKPNSTPQTTFTAAPRTKPNRKPRPAPKPDTKTGTDLDEVENLNVRRSKRVAKRVNYSEEVAAKADKRLENVDEDEDDFKPDNNGKRKRAQLPRTTSTSAASMAARPNVFGPIPGIEVGRVWAMRMECSHDGVHRYGATDPSRSAVNCKVELTDETMI